MGRACFDEYNSEIEIDKLSFTELSSSEINVMNELDSKGRDFAQCRKAVEDYQERKRLRNDIEFFA